VVAHVVSELRREFPQTPLPRITRSVEVATRALPPSRGTVRLLQKAREALRTMV
jgi:hypothetical protein